MMNLHNFKAGWVTNPLFHGEYPEIMRKIIDDKSKAEGRKESRLPSFGKEWSAKVKGTI
jgi:hypothetical protein